MNSRSYKELIVWQKSIDLVEKIYILTEQFPKSELYSLCVQMRRAAISIPSKLKTQGGFTLVELITVIALAVTVSAVGFISMARYRSSNDMKLSLEEVATTMRSMQKRSVSQQDGKRWGVHFYISSSSVSSYTTFKGTSYAGGTTESLYGLRRNILFSNPYTSSTYDMIFTPITGKPSENKVISMASTRKDGTAGDIIARTSGSIITRREIGMVGYWHFDEGMATTTYDASGWGNTGSSTAVTWASGSSCKAGGCISFNGSSDYVDLGNQVVGQDINETSAVTVSYWLNLSGTPSSGNTYQVLGIVIGTNAGGVESKVDENRKITFGGRSQSSDSFQDSSTVTALSTGTWYHLAAVYDYPSDTIKVYLNGVLETTQSVTFGAAKYTHSWTSGADQIGNFPSQSRYLNGKLDEVRIYNRALSAAEILNLYNDLK